MDSLRQWLFPASTEEAKHIQGLLAKKVEREDRFSSPERIAGLDVSNSRFDPTRTLFASIAVLQFPELTLIEQAQAWQKQTFPYVPGLLSFREAPVLIEAFQHLTQRPDLLMVDGQGISHPRGMGIASHLGVLLDIPTIGVAKSILVGHPEGPLGDAVGSQTPLIWKGETVGMLLRTKARAHPLIISTGHRVSLKSAVELVIAACRRYRLPEPTRRAHLGANTYRKQILEEICQKA